jgi:hypothetical protein
LEQDVNKKKQAGTQTEATPFTPRYPAIEKLIDSEDFDALNADFAQAYSELEKISKQKGLGKARDARKAMKSLEKVMDLLKDLLKLKYQYMESQGESTQDGDNNPRKKISRD